MLEEMKIRLAVIVASLTELEKIENFSDEDVTSVNDLNTEYESLKAKIEAKEKIEAIKNSASTSTRKVVSAVKPVKVEVNSPSDKNFGFTDAADFYSSVIKVANNHNDPRFSNTHYEKYGEDGGFLVPAEFITTISEKVQGDESLLTRTTQYNTSGNQIYLPTDENEAWDSSAGVQAYWTGEGAAYTESKQPLDSISLRLHKLTALVKITEEMSEDAPAMESHLRAKAPEAIVAKLNTALISGSGAGQPLGFLSSPFRYTVAKKAAQAADTVVYENIVNMYSRQLNPGKSVWLINPAVMPQLRLMAFLGGVASPVPAYMPPSGLDVTPYGTLMGRPIMPMMGGVKALGDEGDISFIDWSYYTTALKGGIKEDMSAHVFWLNDIKAFKFALRVGGQCLFKSPVTTENGSFDMSGIVTLADR